MKETVPTNQGEKTINEITNSLMYQSYEANMSYGMTHEALVRLGIGNDNFKQAYEKERK